MNKKTWLIYSGVFAGLVIATFVALAVINRSSPMDQNNTNGAQPGNPDSTGGQGTPLSGSSLDLIGSVVSTRNPAGLLVQVNQIDVCTAPDLRAYVALTDKQGSVYSNVKASDFKVNVDGQPVSNFDFSTVRTQDLPLNTVLVLDRSGSMKGEPLSQLKRAANTYVDRAAAGDSLTLIQFDTDIDVILKAASDKNALHQRINGISARGDTALYDAMAKASDSTPDCGRKAVLLMTDGEDTASQGFNEKKAIARANAKNTPVFVVGLPSGGFKPDITRRLAESTGAQYFEAPNPQDLTGIYQKIDDQLGGQYVFRFKLDLTKENKERRLEISVGAEGSETKSVRSFVY